MKFSVLDSAPVRVDGTGAEALTESLERAQQLDQIGCHRLWFTEHHLAPDVASTSPLTMVGQVAARTTNLRLGLILNYNCRTMREGIKRIAL